MDSPFERGEKGEDEEKARERERERERMEQKCLSDYRDYEMSSCGDKSKN